MDNQKIVIKEGLDDQMKTLTSKIDALPVGSEEWLTAVKGQAIIAKTASNIEVSESEISERKANRILGALKTAGFLGLSAVYIVIDTGMKLSVMKFEENGTLKSTLSKGQENIMGVMNKMKTWFNL